jgi:hypothetical protein
MVSMLVFTDVFANSDTFLPCTTLLASATASNKQQISSLAVLVQRMCEGVEVSIRYVSYMPPTHPGTYGDQG